MLIIMFYFFLIFFFQNKEDESTEVLLARSQVALFEVSCAKFSCIHLLPKVLNTYLEHFSMMSARHCGRCGDQMVRVLGSMLGGLSSQTDQVIVFVGKTLYFHRAPLSTSEYTCKWVLVNCQ